MHFRVHAFLWSLIIASCAGCSTVRESRPVAAEAPANTPSPAVPETAQQIVELARAQLGVEYQFAGATPRGFDCSGLVYYVYSVAGITVPRTVAGQRIAAREVALDSLLPADLVFFRSSGAAIDHVVIFIGDGQFVHAPRSGRVVELGRLDDPWYAQRLAGAGRLTASR